MDQLLAALGTVLCSLIAALVTALWRGWLVPAPTIRRERELQNQINEIRRTTAETTLARADIQEANQVKLMGELTDALRQARAGQGV